MTELVPMTKFCSCEIHICSLTFFFLAKIVKWIGAESAQIQTVR